MSWIETIATVVQACAVAAAGWAAVSGLRAWRHELTARRRAELAEHTLAMFYEARDVIEWVRTPDTPDPGNSSRKRDPTEGDFESMVKNSLYVPIERMNRRAEFWGRFDANRYAFMAVFGEKAATPFDTIKSNRARVLNAAEMLLQEFRPEEDEKKEESPEQKEWKRSIGWLWDGRDVVREQVNEAVAAIEEVCKPAIAANVRGSN